MRIFIVSFVHSGSSALAGLLERAGVFVFHDDLARERLGARARRADAAVLNSKGYFERRWLTEYDNTLLRLLGSGGTHTCPLIPWLRGIPQPDGGSAAGVEETSPDWAARELVQVGVTCVCVFRVGPGLRPPSPPYTYTTGTSSPAGGSPRDAGP